MATRQPRSPHGQPVSGLVSLSFGKFLAATMAGPVLMEIFNF
jgi:hypothetical protein